MKSLREIDESYTEAEALEKELEIGQPNQSLLLLKALPLLVEQKFYKELILE